MALSSAPYLSAPFDAQSLREFATDQPPAFWLGRAAVVLLVIAAAASFRSLRLAAGCAIGAVVAAALPAMISSSRGTLTEGWTSYVGTPTPHLPTIYAAPMWGLGWLLALATITAGGLIVAATRPEDRALRLAVALITLVATGASLAIARPETTPDAGGPRRYVDYLPSPSGSTSSTSGWLAAVTVALVIAALATARLHRGRPNP